MNPLDPADPRSPHHGEHLAMVSRFATALATDHALDGGAPDTLPPADRLPELLDRMPTEDEHWTFWTGWVAAALERCRPPQSPPGGWHR